MSKESLCAKADDLADLVEKRDAILDETDEFALDFRSEEQEVAEIFNQTLRLASEKEGARFGAKVPKNMFGTVVRKMVGWSNPKNFLMFHRKGIVSLQAREVMNSDFVHEGKFVGQSREAKLWARYANGALLLTDMANDLRFMRQADTSGASKAIDADQWWDLVGDNIRDGKISEDIPSAVKASVEAATKRYLDFIGPIGQEMIELGLVRKLDLKGTAIDYLTRLYDDIAVAKDVAPDGRRFSEVIEDFYARHGSEDPVADAAATVEHIRKGNVMLDGVSSRDIVGLSDKMKEREILLIDADLKPWLISNPQDIIPTFMHKVMPQIEFAKQTSAQSAMHFGLRSQLDAARVAASEGDVTRAMDLRENSQHINAANMLDATRDSTHGVVARRIEANVIELDAAKARWRSAQAKRRARQGRKKQEGDPTRAALKEAVDDAKQEVDDIRTLLLKDRKEAVRVGDRLYKEFQTDSPLRSKVTFRDTEPKGEVSIAAELQDAETAVFDTLQQEARRNVAQMGLLHSTMSPIALSFEREIAEAKKITNIKKQGRTIRKIRADKDRVFRNLLAMRDVVQNRSTDIFKNPERFAMDIDVLRNLRRYQFMTKMGGVMISSFPDAALPIFVGGFRNYAGALKFRAENIFGGLLNNAGLPVIGRAVASIEHSMHGSTNAFRLNMFEQGARSGVITNVMERGSRAMAKWSGANWWNATNRANTAFTVQTRIINDALVMLKGGKLSSRALADLHGVGIDKRMAKRIIAQWEAHKAGGDNDGFFGIRLPQVDKWTDVGAQRVMETAIVKEARRSPLIPSAGDIPIFMHQEVFKTMTQFTSFFIAATNQVALLGVQRSLYLGDLNFIMGFMVATGLGMAVYYIKETLAGREVSDDPAVWMLEGIDRSGFLGILMQVNDTAEKAFGIGLSQTLTGRPASRFASRGISDSLFGPTIGLAEDTRSILRDMFTGEVTTRTTNRIKRGIPGSNIFYLRTLTDHMVGAFDGMLSIPDRIDSQRQQSQLRPLRF